MPDLVQSRSVNRISIILAAVVGATFGSYFLLPGANLTALSGTLCPPALLLIPAYLEIELRYPGLRHTWVGIGLVIGLIMTLNAGLYATVMHYWNRVAARVSGQ